MKVPGGSPGQVISFEEAQERQRAEDAKRRQRQLRAEALGWVSPTAPSPTDPHTRDPEQDQKAALRRFLDWSATLRGNRSKLRRGRALRRPLLRGYTRVASPEKIQKGQKIARMA